MYETIGFLELNSIAKGVEAADIILKTAEVELIYAKAGCPGKYYILFTGEVAAVSASIEAGKMVGGTHTVDGCIIPRVHPQVISAINMTCMPVETGRRRRYGIFQCDCGCLCGGCGRKSGRCITDGCAARHRHRRQILCCFNR